MATEKEQHVIATLMRDPDFREAWAGVCGIVATLDRDTLDDSDAFFAAVHASLTRLEGVVDRRPELAALIAAAERAEN